MDGWQRLNDVIGLHKIMIPCDTKHGLYGQGGQGLNPTFITLHFRL